MTIDNLFFIYGLCVMFYFMMAWMFWRKNSERLSRLVMMLMLTIGLESVKDLFFIRKSFAGDEWLWQAMTAVDMVAVPMYAFILVELCRPGSLGVRSMVLHMAPFAILPAVFVMTGADAVYIANVVYAGIYGAWFAVWTLRVIPSYHRKLREQYSFEENVNLNWLRFILLSFFVILSLWIVDCTVISFVLEGTYMVVTLVIWMFFSYFLYRHEQAMSGLEVCAVRMGIEPDSVTPNELHVRIERLFSDDHRIYLNSHLKLSDIARMVGSNRTYVSDFFNRANGQTFYGYVNRYRVAYACQLLKNTDKCVEAVGEESGFSSRSTFFRVFSGMMGVTPSEYRRKGAEGDSALASGQ